MTLQADVVVAAVGKRNVLTADMVKPGAVVIDVGMNRNDEGKLCGDVDFDGVKEVAGWITPVPGGVGPMTRAMLLVNTLEAAERAAVSPADRTQRPQRMRGRAGMPARFHCACVLRSLCIRNWSIARSQPDRRTLKARSAAKWAA